MKTIIILLALSITACVSAGEEIAYCLETDGQFLDVTADHVAVHYSRNGGILTAYRNKSSFTPLAVVYFKEYGQVHKGLCASI